MYAWDTGTIIARDRFGNRVYVRQNPMRVLRFDSGGFAWYGRVDFGNRRRFNGYVRSQGELEGALTQLPAAQVKDSNWIDLPESRSNARRSPRQGMEGAIDNLIAHSGYNDPGDHTKYSATRYAAWVKGHPVRQQEWCHLIAHSMGGPDLPSNVVAAAKGNNSEQLAIENILSAYRREGLFQLRVQAGVVDQTNGRHLGTVIRYQIRIPNTTALYSVMLDAAVPVRPSAIHQYTLIRTIATWLNRQTALSHNPVSATDKRQIKRYLQNYDWYLSEEDEDF